MTINLYPNFAVSSFLLDFVTSVQLSSVWESIIYKLCIEYYKYLYLNKTLRQMKIINLSRYIVGTSLVRY